MDISEQRERTLARTGARPILQSFATKVVGVSFTPGYPDNLHALNEVMRPGEPLPAILRRNPDNEYDANAVEVHVPSLGEEWGMIGHLTRPIAARLAPAIDGGAIWAAAVEAVLIDPDYPDRPGISITCALMGEEE